MTKILLTVFDLERVRQIMDFVLKIKFLVDIKGSRIT